MTGGPPVILKLGGALLTDKGGHEAVREAVLLRLAAELAGWQATAKTDLVLAHGSGSFAHNAVVASGYAEHPEDAHRAALVSAAARRLNMRVVETLLAQGLAPMAVPGSALARCQDGEVVAVRSAILRDYLDRGWLPVTYGDIAPDLTRGSAIADTDRLVSALARELAPRRVVLATDVDGVFAADPHLDPEARPLPRLSPATATWMAAGLAGARPGTTDVTGGMASKVRALLALVEAHPAIEVRIVSGLRPGAIAAALDGRPDAGGTLLIAAD